MHKHYPTEGIYKANIASSYYLCEDDEKRYCYIKPSEYVKPESWLADCWIVDLYGNLNPGTDESPVPIRKEDIGRRVM
jgi:hypothetical protein